MGGRKKTQSSSNTHLKSRSHNQDDRQRMHKTTERERGCSDRSGVLHWSICYNLVLITQSLTSPNAAAEPVYYSIFSCRGDHAPGTNSRVPPVTHR